MENLAAEGSSNNRLAAKEVAAAWVGRAGQRDTRAALVAAWSQEELDRALVKRRRMDGSYQFPTGIQATDGSDAC